MTPLGVYQIIATIQYLAYWGKTVYRPWFLKAVLGLRDETTTVENKGEP